MSLKPAAQLVLPKSITPNLLAPGVAPGALEITGTTHTVSLADSNVTLYFSNAAGCAITMPNHTSDNSLQIAFTCDWIQAGAAPLTFLTESGDTLLSAVGATPSSAGVGNTGTMRIAHVTPGPTAPRIWSVSGGIA